MHFPKNGRHFEFWWPFGSYVNYYKSETFLLAYKTFVDIFICVLQVIVLCRWLKKNFSIAAILELAAIAALKRNIRDGNIPVITENIYTMLPAFNKKV